MMKQVTVQRYTNELTCEEWRFSLSDTLCLFVSQYQVLHRATRRHKWVAKKSYHWLFARGSNLSIDAVPLPEDVQAEAIHKIADQLKVVRSLETS